MGEGATQEVIVSQTQGNHTATVKVVHTSRCHVKTSIQENTECGATCDQMAQVMLNEQMDSDKKRTIADCGWCTYSNRLLYQMRIRHSNDCIERDAIRSDDPERSSKAGNDDGRVAKYDIER